MAPGGRRRGALLPLLLAAAAVAASLSLLPHGAHGALFAVDLGSEYLKVSLIKPGRTPISVAVNEMSKRKSPALVGVVNGERLVGEEAFSFGVRYPETIYMRSRDLLGKLPGDATIKSLLADNVLPYDVVPHPLRDVASVRVNENATFSAEELVVGPWGGGGGDGRRRGGRHVGVHALQHVGACAWQQPGSSSQTAAAGCGGWGQSRGLPHDARRRG